MTITKEGSLASFYTVNKAPIKHLRVYFSPKQAGSGTASPENVREIEGWNSINFSHSQKGLAEFGSVGPYNYYFNGYNAQWIKTAQQVVPVTDRNQYYTYSCYIDNTNGTATSQVQVWFKDITNTKYLHVTPGNGIAVGTAGRSVVTFKPSSNDYYLGLGISLKEGAIASEGMLEIGNTMTEYESYKGSLQTIDWSNNAGTVYGGYIDLITGELVQEYGYIEANWGDFTLDKANFADVERRGYSLQGLLPPSGAQNRAQLSNLAVYQYGYQDNVVHIYVAINNIGYVFLPPNTSNDTHIQITYKLATPITHQLSPQSLSTFLGRNSIWSNADRVEVEYDLAESNDELYRRRNIILQGAPHLETVTGNIANFKTDLIAPIKEVKVYFEPIQEGSGTPSLENVREINGWNSTNIQHSSKNMLNPAYYTKGSSYTLNGTTYTYDGNGTVTLNGKSNGESSQVTFSWTQSFDCDYYFCGNCSFDTSVGDVYMWDVTTSARPTKWDGTTKSGASYPSSNLQQVKLLAGHHIQLCVRVYSVSTTELTNATAQPMLLPKTCTNTTFESYNGQTIPITFPTTGKNLYDANTYPLTIGKWIHGSNGRDSESSALAATMGFIPCKNFAGKTVTLNKHLSAEIWNPGVAFYNANKEFISGINNNGSSGSYTTFIVPENASYLRFTVMSDSTNIQLELGSSATTYEPYTNTIYGGYVDLTNGEIVQTHFLFQRRVGDMDNNESYPGWKNCSDFKAIANYIDNTDNGYRYNLICNVGDRIWYNSKSTNPTVFIYLEMKNNMTQTEWKTNYPDLVMKWVLPLAAPIHHPLTPQTLKTLKATNNIWSSANGPVSIKYWTH